MELNSSLGEDRPSNEGTSPAAPEILGRNLLARHISFPRSGSVGPKIARRMGGFGRDRSGLMRELHQRWRVGSGGYGWPDLYWLQPRRPRELPREGMRSTMPGVVRKATPLSCGVIHAPFAIERIHPNAELPAEGVANCMSGRTPLTQRAPAAGLDGPESVVTVDLPTTGPRQEGAAPREINSPVRVLARGMDQPKVDQPTVDHPRVDPVKDDQPAAENARSQQSTLPADSVGRERAAAHLPPSPAA